MYKIENTMQIYPDSTAHQSYSKINVEMLIIYFTMSCKYLLKADLQKNEIL